MPCLPLPACSTAITAAMSLSTASRRSLMAGSTTVSSHFRFHHLREFVYFRDIQAT
jgi:hypothetical protein